MKLGLAKNEAKVYLALLKLGKATVVEIARRSKVHRVNVYDILERLKEKGLISSIIQAQKKVYEAANPEQLSTLLQQKEEALKQILPALKQEFKLKKEKQQVYHFFGPEGVLRAYFMCLEQNGASIYAIGGSGLNRKYLKHRHELFLKEAKRNGIKFNLLYYEFKRKDRKTMWEEDIKIRYIPDKFKTLGMVDVCGDLVLNLLPIEGNIMAIVIENKVLADTYRQFFHFMWENAKE